MNKLKTDDKNIALALNSVKSNQLESKETELLSASVLNDLGENTPNDKNLYSKALKIVGENKHFSPANKE
jgi:hypothetical protein